MRKKEVVEKSIIKIGKIGIFFLIAFIVGISAVTVGSIFIEQLNKTEELSIEVLEEVESIYADIENERRNEDYKNGIVGMPGDDESILDEEPDSEEGNIMCQDLYDDEGVLLWKGLTQKEAEQADDELVAKWEEIYETYSNATARINEETLLYIEDKANYADSLTNLCLEYYEKIPYAADSYSYYKGFEKEEDYNNIPYIQKGQNGFGLGNLGYVTWVMRNVMGKTPDALEGKSFNPKKAIKVKKESLKVGDICVHTTEYGKRYGIVVDKIDEDVIVGICDAIGNLKFPAGCTHFVYLEDAECKYIGAYSSVPFDTFYRLPEFEKGE